MSATWRASPRTWDRSARSACTVSIIAAAPQVGAELLQLAPVPPVQDQPSRRRAEGACQPMPQAAGGPGDQDRAFSHRLLPPAAVTFSPAAPASILPLRPPAR